MPIIEMTGKKFGRLTVIKKIKVIKEVCFWECICDCGKKKTISGSSLRSGNTQSCGCLNLEIITAMKLTHGMSRTKFHSKWVSMTNRCRNKKCTGYKSYGGRGIKVEKEWLIFENFKEDMYQSFLESVKKNGLNDTTLDRIDVNGNYCKENCRWATKKQQIHNRRTSKNL